MTHERNHVVRLFGHDNAPPRRNHCTSILSMALGKHNGHEVENLTVQLDLCGKSAEGIGKRLDLEAVQHAVHNGEVDANLTLPNTKFINDGSVGFGSMHRFDFSPQDRPNVSVAHLGDTLLRLFFGSAKHGGKHRTWALACPSCAFRGAVRQAPQGAPVLDASLTEVPRPTEKKRRQPEVTARPAGTAMEFPAEGRFLRLALVRREV